MTGRPKVGFWIVVGVVVLSLATLAVYRSGLLQTGPAETSSANPTKTISINFYSSSAKANWVNEIVKDFNSSRIMAGDKVVRVAAHHVTSGGSLDDLKAGKIKPDIWSPGDESWLQLAAAHWRDVKQGELFENYRPLVNIPLIVAMWEPMARVLGYPGPIGWRDIARAAANPRGWAAYGHPEWGRFRWGHAHPDANSGFLTVISEVYAVLGKTGGLTARDLKNPEVASFLTEFEGAVEHYGLSNSWIDDLMHKKGPAYLSAAVQYENTIIQTNEKHENKPFKLVALYPSEGNFWTRHPAAILNGDWMTPEKALASGKFIDFLLSEKSQEKAMKMGLRPIAENFTLGSPFDDAHGVKPDIGPVRIFEVPGEDVLKRIRDLWENVKIPATLILALDRSGSMKGEPMDNAKAGAIEFIKNMKPRDELQIVAFSQDISPLTGLCKVKDCGEDAVNRLAGLFAEGKTSLYDVIADNYRALVELKSRNPGRRYSLLVLSDGKDTASKLDRYDFLDLLPKGEEYDVPKIYSIAYGPEADRDLLTEISNRTNARLFSSSPSEIAKTYKELSANF